MASLLKQDCTHSFTHAWKFLLSTWYVSGRVLDTEVGDANEAL